MQYKHLAAVILVAGLLMFYYSQSFALVAHIDMLSLLAEGFITSCVFVLLVVIQRLKQDTHIYRLLMTGFSLLFLSMLTDTLDEIYYASNTLTFIVEDLGQVLGFLFMMWGIHVWARHNQGIQDQLTRLAVTDPLTQLLNRRGIEDKLRQELERSRRYNQYFSILLIDIDYFKTINDTHGHAAGDRVLASFAANLRNNLRITDAVARWGGEEFLVLLPEYQQEAVLKVAEKLRERTADATFDINDHQHIRLSISVGVAICSTDDIDTDAVISRADEALYQAKLLGRNRVKILP